MGIRDWMAMKYADTKYKKRKKRPRDLESTAM